MKKILLVLPLAIMLCLAFGCKQQGEEAAEESAADVEIEKTNIRTVLEQYVEAWKTLNIDLFSQIFSHDADMSLFDTQRKYVGWEAFKEMLLSSFELMSDVNITFRDYSIKVHRSGTAAWISAYEDATWIFQDQPGEAKGMRVTWVLEKREGRWVIVQGHWSVSEEVEESE
jgi:uncharacterized protein (TIGR02246 family)